MDKNRQALNHPITSWSVFLFPSCQLLYTLNPPTNPKTAPSTRTAPDIAWKYWMMTFSPSIKSEIPGGIWANTFGKAAKNMETEIKSIGMIFILVDYFLCKLNGVILGELDYFR